jgi:dihydrofolate reductase
MEEVAKLKRQPGKDLIVYGGSSFVSALIAARLIDEFHLFVNPVAIGSGGAIFDGLKQYKPLELKNSIVYNSGIVLLHYEPK